MYIFKGAVWDFMFQYFPGFLVLSYIYIVCYVVPGQSYRQLKASESCDHDDEDDVEIAQRILELSHIRRLSHL